MRLMDTDDTMVAPIGLCVIHFPLLAIDFLDNPIIPLLAKGQWKAAGF